MVRSASFSSRPPIPHALQNSDLYTSGISTSTTGLGALPGMQRRTLRQQLAPVPAPSTPLRQQRRRPVVNNVFDAALRIQSVWRGHRVRRNIRIVARYCLLSLSASAQAAAASPRHARTTSATSLTLANLQPPVSSRSGRDSALSHKLRIMGDVKTVLWITGHARNHGPIHSVPQLPMPLVSAVFRIIRGLAAPVDVVGCGDYSPRCIGLQWGFLRHNRYLLALSLLLCLLASAVVALVPGLVALMAKLLFHDGHSAFSIEHVLAWMLCLSLAALVSLGCGTLCLNRVSEKYAQRVESHVVGMSTLHPYALNHRQTVALRDVDLGIVKEFISRDFPSAFILFAACVASFVMTGMAVPIFLTILFWHVLAGEALRHFYWNYVQNREKTMLRYDQIEGQQWGVTSGGVPTMTVPVTPAVDTGASPGPRSSPFPDHSPDAEERAAPAVTPPRRRKATQVFVIGGRSSALMAARASAGFALDVVHAVATTTDAAVHIFSAVVLLMFALLQLADETKRSVGTQTSTVHSVVVSLLYALTAGVCRAALARALGNMCKALPHIRRLSAILALAEYNEGRSLKARMSASTRTRATTASMPGPSNPPDRPLVEANKVERLRKFLWSVRVTLWVFVALLGGACIALLIFVAIIPGVPLNCQTVTATCTVRGGTIDVVTPGPVYNVTVYPVDFTPMQLELPQLFSFADGCSIRVPIAKTLMTCSKNMSRQLEIIRYNQLNSGNVTSGWVSRQTNPPVFFTARVEYQTLATGHLRGMEKYYQADPIPGYPRSTCPVPGPDYTWRSTYTNPLETIPETTVCKRGCLSDDAIGSATNDTTVPDLGP